MAQLITRSDYNTGVKPAPTCDGSEVIAVRDTISFAATKSVNDIGALMCLPANHLPVDVILDSDDGDGGTSLTLSVGVLNSGRTDLSTTTADGGAVWMDGSTVGQAGGIARPTTKTITRVKPSNSDRYIGVKIKANGDATACVVGVTLLYRSQTYEPVDS